MFANLGFRFNNKWCYKSEEITAIFLQLLQRRKGSRRRPRTAAVDRFRFLRIRFFEQINIRMEVNNRYSCGGKNWFGRD